MVHINIYYQNFNLIDAKQIFSGNSECSSIHLTFEFMHKTELEQGTPGCNVINHHPSAFPRVIQKRNCRVWGKSGNRILHPIDQQNRFG